MALTNKLTAIANAIRSKTGSSAKLTLDQMPTAINSISTGGGGTSDNKFNEFMRGTITTLTAADLEGVTKIRERTFYGTALESITIPEWVTTIESYSFFKTKIESLVLPGSITTMKASAFAHCDSLHTVTIGSGITELPTYLFYDCSILSTIYIPKSVTKIGSKALANTDLQNIYYEGTAEEWAAITIDASNNEYLYGPGGTLDAPSSFFAPNIHYSSYNP